VRAALALARSENLSVRFKTLGEWGSAALLSEYDPATRTIAVNALVWSRLREARGEAFAARFMVCALLHEIGHHRFPERGELAAHAFARERCGDDPLVFEAALRA